jgi:hypothetical protein
MNYVKKKESSEGKLNFILDEEQISKIQKAQGKKQDVHDSGKGRSAFRVDLSHKYHDVQ